MAGAGEYPDLWLPSEFPTDSDHLFLNGTGLPSNLCLPPEFPFDFPSPSVTTSPIGSTESDEDDSFPGLAFSSFLDPRKPSPFLHCSEKGLILSESPQSTLAKASEVDWSARSAQWENGFINGPYRASSQRTTSLGDGGRGFDWETIAELAGHVWRLELNGGSRGPVPPSGGRLVDPAWTTRAHAQSTPLVKNPNSAGSYSNRPLTNHFLDARKEEIVKQQVREALARRARGGWGFLQNQGSLVRNGTSDGFLGGGKCGKPLDFPKSTWPGLSVHGHHHQNQRLQNGGAGTRTVQFGGSVGGGAKRQCAGTGVFLPRRYTNPSELNKTAGCPTALLPAKVVPSFNKNFENTYAHAPAPAPAPPQPQPCLNGAWAPDRDVLMARRNLLLAQIKRNMRRENAMDHAGCLPLEWTH